MVLSVFPTGLSGSGVGIGARVACARAHYVERLRDMGLGVILISHNLNDVRAVADRIEVLRHGRNNGSFDAATASYEEVLSAITGATRRRVSR